MKNDDTFYSVKLHICVDPAMREKLHEVAKAQRIKASELVRRLILNYFDKLKGVSEDATKKRPRGQD